MHTYPSIAYHFWYIVIMNQKELLTKESRLEQQIFKLSSSENTLQKLIHVCEEKGYVAHYILEPVYYIPPPFGERERELH